MTASDWKIKCGYFFLTQTGFFAYKKNNFEKWRVYENCGSWGNWTGR